MIDIYFATNRNPLGGQPPSNFGADLGPIDGMSLRFGWAEVDDAATRIENIHVADEILTPDSGAAQLLGSSEVFTTIQRKMLSHGRDTLGYIHGFNYTFTEAITRAAQFKKFLQADMNLFLFTWPSDGKSLPDLSFKLPYHRDRDDAAASGEAMGRGLRVLTRFLGGQRPAEACDRRLHLLAHSMGNYALRHAVLGIGRQLGTRHLPKLFDTVILAGADEDADALEKTEKMMDLPRMTDRIAVYHTPRDRALIISEDTKGNPERLGSDGPDNTANLSDKIAVINVSDVLKADNDIQNHQYYWQNPYVREDMLAVFRNVPANEISGRRVLPGTNRYRLIG